MKVEVQFEDGTWVHSLGEHNIMFKQMVYDRVRTIERKSEGCPLKVIIDFEEPDIEELKHICEVKYWKLPSNK